MNTNSDFHEPHDTSEVSDSENSHTSGPPTQQQVTLRGPAQLADSLPYLLGFHPTDSVVMVSLHGRNGRFGGRLRVGIPKSPQEWAPVASHLAECLVTNSERRGARPDGVLLFLCQDPAAGQTGRQVMERLRAFAQRLRTACGALDVPVLEALCLSGGRFWSYCCPDGRCCPPEGTGLALPGTSVMAAAAAYAGIQVRGTLREMEERLAPRPMGPDALRALVRALDSAGSAVIPRILSDTGRAQVEKETLDLARVLIRRLSQAPPAKASWAAADGVDDELVSDGEAATLLVGIQDRDTRDHAAQWMEGPEAVHALRLWRVLARRCVGAYDTYAAPPLSLAGWVAWSTGDEPGARVALGLALQVDEHYTFAQLLHQACNEGLDPEELRSCLRKEHSARADGASARPGRSGGPNRSTAHSRTGMRARSAARTRAAARERKVSGSGAGRGSGRGLGSGSRPDSIRGPVARDGARGSRMRPAAGPSGPRSGPAGARGGVRRRETPPRERRGTRHGR